MAFASTSSSNTICTNLIPTHSLSSSTKKWFTLNLFSSSLSSTSNPFYKTTKPTKCALQSPPSIPVHHCLPVEGTIPDHIDGVYLRNGAKTMFEPTSGHHLFDGDGMIYAVKFDNGSASYACRFTETQGLIQERAYGKPVFPKTIGELHGHSSIAKLLWF